MILWQARCISHALFTTIAGLQRAVSREDAPMPRKDWGPCDPEVACTHLPDGASVPPSISDIGNDFMAHSIMEGKKNPFASLTGTGKRHSIAEDGANLLLSHRCDV